MDIEAISGGQQNPGWFATKRSAHSFVPYQFDSTSWKTSLLIQLLLG
jgi:hypothetical protein